MSLCTLMDYSPKNPGVGSHSLHQGIFPTQGLNRGLLHYREILYHLSHWGSPNNGINLWGALGDLGISRLAGTQVFVISYL